MPTPKPLPPDGDPPRDLTAAERSVSPPLDYAAEDIDTTRTEDELPESLPSSSTDNS
jgi:hypothetical protein